MDFVGLYIDVNTTWDDYQRGILTKAGLAAQLRSISNRVRHADLAYDEADTIVDTIGLIVEQVGLENE